MEWAKTTAKRNEINFCFGIWYSYIRDLTVKVLCSFHTITQPVFFSSGINITTIEIFCAMATVNNVELAIDKRINDLKPPTNNSSNTNNHCYWKNDIHWCEITYCSRCIAWCVSTKQTTHHPGIYIYTRFSQEVSLISWPDDVISRLECWSTLAQVMACCDSLLSLSKLSTDTGITEMADWPLYPETPYSLKCDKHGIKICSRIFSDKILI